jgi:hypothetical protein
MQGLFEVHIVGKGVYGPFKQENGAPDQMYPYVVLTAADGEGDPVKATYAPGLDYVPRLFVPVRVVLELREGGKLRFHGEAPASVKAA